MTDATQTYTPDAAPQLIGGRYELGGGIGYGGMAEVYRGRDIRLGREVAIKTLRSDLARDPTFLARFQREAQSSAALNHPAIVSVYDTGEDVINGTHIPYIVMEFIEGRTLRDALQAEGRFTERRAMEITSDVCAALDYSHRMGIIHRDIKPANVMLSPDGAVKVMDFGIARATTATSSTMTATAAVIGTAQYLSPEQARGARVDARSDVYTTGVLLYELLTGAPPFRGDNPVAVAYQHVREDPDPPSAHDRDISPEADAIVLKAMEKDADDRYLTAGEMRDDLERALAGRQVQAMMGGGGASGAATTLGPAAGTAVLGRGDRAGYPTRDRYGDDRYGDDATSFAPAAGAYADAPYDDGRFGTGPFDRYDLTGALDRRAVPGSPQKSQAWKYILAGLGVVVVFVAVVLLASTFLSGGGGGGGSGDQIAVPKGLIGLNEQNARARLQSAGFRGTVTLSSVDDPDKAGQVTKVDPAEGTEVDVAGTITLFIGKAAGDVTIPSDLVGKTQTEAEQQLRGLGLNPTIMPFYNQTTQKVGRVDSTDPAVGGPVKAGSTVTVYVVSANVNVPDVRNRSYDSAVAELGRWGLNATRQDVANNNVAPGTVVDQQPSGTNVARGSTVTLSVAAQIQTTPPPSPTTTQPTDQEPTQTPGGGQTPTPGTGGQTPSTGPTGVLGGGAGAAAARRPGSGTGTGVGGGTGGGNGGAGGGNGGTGSGTGGTGTN
ncbi:Stk1 family PASTA domain-containing Ser/Thr kinase [Frankia sp. R82]|uniref:Stk1 family PASTA domain-containing Ser/Thr kinase n=1 Tax=Frankia sp. R82 TaxID=2950553 RepID=UPI002044BD3E|nr:Stk1 family PASTA domain-containing Ser/Thr kinase [Frankia sp. R82]MCM3885935.1 Stk1 family PASTA domain-containing Ser/Thr kinase [Frankia sp. R82]